ncbi:hypothetical protein GCM10010169_43470 [Micromonospora fulviviridis]|nr:hypothetical protein GCM10010169_43470 [Micromonospora fulviviridis]
MASATRGSTARITSSALRKAVDSAFSDMRPPGDVRKAQALGMRPHDGAAPRWFSIPTRQSRPAPILPGCAGAGPAHLRRAPAGLGRPGLGKPLGCGGGAARPAPGKEEARG